MKETDQFNWARDQKDPRTGFYYCAEPQALTHVSAYGKHAGIVMLTVCWEGWMTGTPLPLSTFFLVVEVEVWRLLRS